MDNHCCDELLLSLSLSLSLIHSFSPQGGYMTSDQISLIRKQLYTLLQVVRKEAVPLVDTFDIPDEILNSVLGRYDGNVYTHLYEWALKAPRNKKQVRMQQLSSLVQGHSLQVHYFEAKFCHIYQL